MTKIARRNFVITNAAAITASTCSILLATGLANIASASPLHDAAKEGDLARIEQLLAQGADINERAGPATSLHIAIQQGHAKAAELLITRGADVNATSTWGTPVYLAASAGLTDIVRLLLERGADANVGRQAQTPLHVTARVGRTEIVRLLLDHGADTDALTELDEPPLHLAIVQGHAETADLLRERGTMAPRVEEIAGLLASADPARGELRALRCKGCHAMDQSGKAMKGPPLWDIVGRPKASFGEFKYSPALKAVGGDWTYEALNNFLAHPAWTIPGTRMVMKGIHNPRDRADLISFLRTLSNNPLALP
jgi:cytochrome c